MAANSADTASEGPVGNSVTIPILVGVTGKRKDKLKALGVPETLVRTKLRRAFAFLERLAPTSPKILLCGMADGVDEIAAKLVIEAVGEGGGREFKNWSIVGLLPLPEEAFLDDFDASAGEDWWYRELNEAQRSIVRLVPLETLRKPATSARDRQVDRFTVDELRRRKGSSNPVRTCHYEQLGLVLAERSTVLIVVMPEAEAPNRLGGTAQVAGHRVNGWRADWPGAASRATAADSTEFVVPPALAECGSRDAWLISVGQKGNLPNPVDLRILRRRDEFDLPWPEAIPRVVPTSLFQGVVARCRVWWRSLFGDPDVLIAEGRHFEKNARSSCPLLNAIERFNSRAAKLSPRPPPAWDESIAAHPADPGLWSPVAAAERVRGTLSDVQGSHKILVQKTAKWLGVIAWVSIATLELYAEKFTKFWFLPFFYVVLVGTAIWLFGKSRRNSWAAVTEDYRMVAEALRVQISWWQLGLIERSGRVDHILLRYDAREFQTLRQGLATVLDALQFRHARYPAVQRTAALPGPVSDWVGMGGSGESGQIRYHHRTARQRNEIYDRFEFSSWLCFGISLGMSILLALSAVVEAWHIKFLEQLAEAAYSPIWSVALLVFLSITLLAALSLENLEGNAVTVAFRRLVWSTIVGFLCCAVFVAHWHMYHWNAMLGELHTILTLGTLLFLAAAGAIRYVAEKVAVEAEAQGSVEAFIVYSRARRMLDQVYRDYAAQSIDGETARQRNEQIIRDLGNYALVETEAWLRSHRERPLHPAVGS